MTVFNWSTTAASNDTADSTVNWREAQAPSTVNDSARAMMAAIAKWRDDKSGNLVTAGTSTAYTLTTNQVFTALTDGISVTCRMDETNGAAPTLNVDSLGAKAIASLYGTAIGTGVLLAGTIQTFTYDSTDQKWITHAWRDSYVPGGTDVAVADGGTGASTAANARTNLGVTATGSDTTYNYRANNLSDVANAATAFANIKQTATTSATGVVQIATQAAMEAITVQRVVTADVQHHHPGHPKFWLYTTGGASPSIATSYNVTSITDGGSGVLTTTIATDFSSANWCCLATASASGDQVVRERQASKAAGSCVTESTLSGSGAPFDVDGMNIMGLGDQA